MKPRVEVQGLTELRKALNTVDKNLGKELGQANKRVAEIVARGTRAAMPERSGALRGSVTARAQQRYGVVQVGKPNVPYAGWMEFGGRRRLAYTRQREATPSRPIIKIGRYAYPTVYDNREELREVYEDELERLLRRAGLLGGAGG